MTETSKGPQRFEVSALDEAVEAAVAQIGEDADRMVAAVMEDRRFRGTSPYDAVSPLEARAIAVGAASAAVALIIKTLHAAGVFAPKADS